MSRAQNANVDAAYRLYKQGKPLVDIAHKLSVPEGTVRRWKSTYGWDSERSDKSERLEIKANEIKALDKSNLTDKQKMFCIYYVKCFNATKAYRKAYECDEYSARVNGCRLLTKDNVGAEINRLKQDKYNQAYLKPEDIFQKYMDIAFSDITDFLEFGLSEVQVMGPFGPLFEKDEKTGERTPITKTVNAVRFKNSSEVDGTIIGEVKQGKDGASIKLADRMKALDWLTEHMDLATEEQKAKLALDRERLALERVRVGRDEPKKKVFKIIVDPYAEVADG